LAASVSLVPRKGCGAIFLDAVAGVYYTFAAPRTASGIGPSLPINVGRNSSFEEDRMAKISFTLKNITKDIEQAEKKLRALRGKVVKADVKKIELNLRALKKAHRIIVQICPPISHYGQHFQSKSK
jgi:hypothetical protein